MKAVVQTRYGSPVEALEIREVPEPVPRDGELLIEVKATVVTSGDARLRALRMPPGVVGVILRVVLRLTGPRGQILGFDAAGIVKAVGKDVTRFKVGDAVFGAVGFKMGANAEYVCVKERGAVLHKPAGVSFEEAAAIPFGAFTALYYLKDLAKVKSGQRVLVIGASGCVGTYSVQLAKHYGAEVVGVCSAANAELVRGLGADRVIDYAKEDFTREAGAYDVIFDTVETTTFAKCKAALRPRGQFLAAVMSGTELWQILWTWVVGGKKVKGGVSPTRKEDLQFLVDLVEAGKMRVVIGKKFRLEEIVEAHRYVDSGRKVGSAVVGVGWEETERRRDGV